MPEAIQLIAGFLSAFLVGLICALLKIPSPAPPQFVGAFIVIAITLGYLASQFLF